jgi:hypothetical protein
MVSITPKDKIINELAHKKQIMDCLATESWKNNILNI